MSGGVFDLDGTLASTAMAHLRAWQLALAEVGVTDVKIEIRGLLGMRAYDIAKEIVRAAGLSYDMIGKLIDLKVKHFDVIVPSLAKPMPCAVNMARALRGRGMKFVVVTSSLRRNAVRVLESIGLKPDVLVAGDDVDRGKPDPEPVLLALELAGLSPKEVFAVGDTLNDVKAYRSAGIDRVYLVKGDVEVPVDESELKGLGAHRVESLCDVMRLEGLT
ncbi:MAG: haloacid dehalogenase superfamily, subfamily IA, variant 3 with third motif having DD or ED/haloacid dehalogenase superfamily, subfamily IA, variant 1 with third motif having Dx(3-4)D or Dx(3-4)E [uncultured Acidilobus sp. CIS]|nr:MAG: haloacid dehalogenase superfamily, subfamily IA, variant 3 with third motif having DD or ED/haloacid dehalogenase superfamily, subfamily IA, variant 1 with third motif having Dx(3-4)D or Dx(3-4)E [uncultured Acidilobus sp. CIS]